MGTRRDSEPTPAPVDGLREACQRCGKDAVEGHFGLCCRCAERTADEAIAGRRAAAPQGEPGLDVAWAEVEAALPKGWWLDGLYQRRLPEGETWEVLAGEDDYQGAEDYHFATGPTPVAALRALAAELNGDPLSDPEPIANETESGYTRRRELVVQARLARQEARDGE